jgi:flagellar assembly protein FliH
LDVAANPTRKDSEARLSETQREMIFEEARRAALDAVQQDAAEVRARARQEAEEIMRQALSSAEDARERARLEGMADAHRQTEDLVKMAGQLVKELTDWQARMFAQSESQVLGLVSDMAEKLFGCGFRLEESLLKNVYERALSEAKALGSLRLRANPSDITRLDELWPVQQMALRGQKIELVPDQDVLPGGCFIEGEYGSVDARVSTELRLMQDCLDETADSPESGEKAFATYDSTHRGSA